MQLPRKFLSQLGLRNNLYGSESISKVVVVVIIYLHSFQYTSALQITIQVLSKLIFSHCIYRGGHNYLVKYNFSE